MLTTDQSAQGDVNLRDGEQGKVPKMEERNTSPARAKKKSSSKDNLSRALRTVYDETLREDVPDDFLDLLGKLD